MVMRANAGNKENKSFSKTGHLTFPRFDNRENRHASLNISKVHVGSGHAICTAICNTYILQRNVSNAAIYNNLRWVWFFETRCGKLDACHLMLFSSKD